MFLSLNPGAVGIAVPSLEALVHLAAQAGFEGVDLPPGAVETEADADRARHLIESAGLQWGLFSRPVDFFGDEEEYRRGLERLKVLAPHMASAGCTRTYDHIWSGSDLRPYEENWRFHKERLKPVAGLLAEHGIRFGIEFLGPKTLRDGFTHPFFYRVEQAVELIHAVGEGTGLVLDTFHWHTSGGDLETLRSLLPQVPIVNLHVNDARADRSRDEQMDMERAMPLETGVIDAVSVVALLVELGYNGPMIAEPFSPQRDRLAALPPPQAAMEVRHSLTTLRDRALEVVAQSQPPS